MLSSRDVGPSLGYLLGLVPLLGHPAVRGVDVVLEQLVLAEGGGAHGALVGEVGGLQGLAVVLGHVVEQLPLVHLHRGVRGGVAENVLECDGLCLYIADTVLKGWCT